MKTIIVYFSLEGNTAYAAERMAAAAGADLLRLIPKKAYRDKGAAKILLGGMHAVRGQKPALEDYDVDLALYDRVVFGFPIWASRVTPPLRTFIEDNADALAGKTFAAFACQAGSGGEKVIGLLGQMLGIDAFEKTAVFVDPKKRQTAETDAAIDAFAAGL